MNSTNKDNKHERMELFVGVIIFLCIFFAALRVPLDSDFFWHINAGATSLAQKTPLLHDPFSFTRSGSEWVNHSWLAQIIFYLVFRWFSFRGVMVFVAILATSTMILIYVQMRGSALMRSFLMILALLISALVWSPRPQLFTLLCFSLLIMLVRNYEQNQSRKNFFRIVILFIIWSNLHAGFSIGIAYLGLFFFGKLMDAFWDKGLKKLNRRQLVGFLSLFTISALAVCINPNGLNIWKVQFETVSINSLQLYIDEWASPNFHDLNQQPYLWTWLIFVFSLAISDRRLQFKKLLPILFFGALGFLTKRNFAPFAIIIFPVLSALIVDIYEKNVKVWLEEPSKSKLSRFVKIEPKPVIQKLINLSFAGLLMFVVAGKLIYLGDPVVINAYEYKLLPKQAYETIAAKGIPDGNVLNSYNWGGYLNWKNTDIKVFVDGRTDLFGDVIIEDWLEMVSAGDNWQELFEKYDIHWTFLEKGSPINKILIDNGWLIYYEDDRVTILTKD